MNKKQQVITARSFTTRCQGKSLRLLNEVCIQISTGLLTVRAQWDTGASRTCIAQELVDELQLVSTGNQIAHTPSGKSIFNTYCVDLVLPNNIGLRDVPVMGSEIGKQGIDLLIGMDIIGIGDFAVSCFKGITQFSFRYPSLCDADFGNNQVDGFKGTTIVKPPKIQPNDPCPCGSGNKYKFCCGKNK